MKPKYTKLAAGLSILAMSFSFLALPAVSSADNDHNAWRPDLQKPEHHQRVCNRDDKNPDTAACDAHVLTDASGNVQKFVTPSGYGPTQLKTAYGLTGLASSKKIIGIVDAYDDPNIQSDLNTYSTQFGIPPLPACSGTISSSAVPCFKKVDQSGGTRYPSRNSGWDLEIALDVETAHAVCQNCSVLLVEASSATYGNLMTAVDRAASLGANIISNSWGGSEFNGETTYDSHLNKPGVAITFSSGDSGFGVEYPASSKYVTAVGGTTLVPASTPRGYAETAWSGAGSGCSVYETKPSWQTDIGCSRRSVADVSADADPASGAAVYDSVAYSGYVGWFQVGGTSLASPIVAATYAQGATIPSGTAANQMPYLHIAGLNDVISGSNGSCSGGYLCTAIPGYDGPTGLGSPNGTTAF